MKRSLPPLNAIRAFEATSRHLSATRAAAELHITPAAISHQIKILESYFETKLFKRLNRQLLLTDAGQNYALALQDIFNRLKEETKKITKHQQTSLSITVEPAFAMYWLVPRISKFKKLHPGIDLKIDASYEVVDFKKNQIDLGIRCSQGKHPGLVSTLLFRNELYTVCNPCILEKQPLNKPNDLKQHVLLHETAAISYPDYPNWEIWLKAAGANEVDPAMGLFFETGYLLIQAALDGQGIALERRAFVESLIEKGRLVRPFNFSLKQKTGGYHLVIPEHRVNDPKIEAFRKWMLSETKHLREKILEPA